MKLNIAKIESEMNKQGLSQSDIARKLDLSRQRIHQIIKEGAKSFRVVENIAGILGVEPKDLISD